MKNFAQYFVQPRLDDICYTALYYEVDDTTLFAVKVAKQKQQCEVQIYRQREKENIGTTDVNYENESSDDGVGKMNVVCLKCSLKC